MRAGSVSMRKGLAAGISRATCVPRAMLSTATNGRPAAASPVAASFFDPVKQAAVPVPDDVAPLFQPIQVGSLSLAHRIVMAPLTRCRATNRVPTPAMKTYYEQRASKGGLLITEATIVSPTGAGYPQTPGIYSDEQVKAWRTITDAVHAKGGVILCQLWHCGRMSHPDYQPNGELPMSSSNIAPREPLKVFSPVAMAEVPFVAPRPMTKEDIKEMLKIWQTAGKRAMEAGFDGVEIHGANGYLLDQFLKDCANKRTDEYGGPIENRARFHLEVTKAVIDGVGDAGRVGIRVSPFQDYGDMSDSTPYATHVYLAEQLKALKIAYLHMTESRVDTRGFMSDGDVPNVESLDAFRVAFSGRFMAAGGYKRDEAAAAVRSGRCDLVAFGRPFISSPDLPARLLANVPPAKWDRNTFYSFDEKGYTDYPFMS